MDAPAKVLASAAAVSGKRLAATTEDWLGQVTRTTAGAVTGLNQFDDDGVAGGVDGARY
jgi:hypothetical protein